MKRFMYLLPLVFIMAFSLVAQDFSADHFTSGQPVLLDSSGHQLNFYDFGQNPAGLFDDGHRESLQIRYYGETVSGQNRLPFDAQKIFEQHYFIRIVQPLTENDIFKGYFAYHRQFDKNIMYLDQSENLGSNPFLLADSSIGDFALNGLYWGAEWAHRFNAQWQSGMAFYYNVDQRLKNIFPKPLDKHLNIHFNYGLQYKAKSWAAGLSYKYTENQEALKISPYGESQDQTAVLFRYRFSDLAKRDTGLTSLERKISDYRHQLALQVKKEFGDLILIGAYSQYKSKTKIIDDGSRNDTQGSFEELTHLVKTQLVYQSKKFDTRLNYAYQNTRFEANHHDFDFVIWQAPEEQHQLWSYSKFKYWRKLNLFFDAGYTWYNNNRIDRMSDNYWRYQKRQLAAKSGFQFRYNERFELAAWYGLNHSQNLSAERSDNSYSQYYAYLFEEPYQYYTSDMHQNTAGFQLVYHYGPMLDIEFFITRLNLVHKNKQREHLLFGIHTNMYIF